MKTYFISYYATEWKDGKYRRIHKIPSNVVVELEFASGETTSEKLMKILYKLSEEVNVEAFNIAIVSMCEL